MEETREYIEEIENNLLLLKYLYKVFNSYSEEIKNILIVRRKKYIARKAALKFVSENMKIEVINIEIEKTKIITSDLFQGINVLTSKEDMSPVVYDREYIMTLEEMKKIMQIYS